MLAVLLQSTLTSVVSKQTLLADQQSQQAFLPGPFCYRGNCITGQKHPYPYSSNTSSAPTIFHC